MELTLIEVYEDQMTKHNVRKGSGTCQVPCGHRLGILRKEMTRHPPTDSHFSSGV
jgi:hypothetical protein